MWALSAEQTHAVWGRDSFDSGWAMGRVIPTEAEGRQRQKADRGKPASWMKINFLRNSENLDRQDLSQGKAPPQQPESARSVWRQKSNMKRVINVVMGSQMSHHKFLPGMRARASRLSAGRSLLQGGH